MSVPVISPTKLFNMENKYTNVFISNNYVDVLKNELDKNNFENVYQCFDILSKTNFSKAKVLNQYTL